MCLQVLHDPVRTRAGGSSPPSHVWSGHCWRLSGVMTAGLKQSARSKRPTLEAVSLLPCCPAPVTRPKASQPMCCGTCARARHALGTLQTGVSACQLLLQLLSSLHALQAMGRQPLLKKRHRALNGKACCWLLTLRHMHQQRCPVLCAAQRTPSCLGLAVCRHCLRCCAPHHVPSGCQRPSWAMLGSWASNVLIHAAHAAAEVKDPSRQA